MIGRNALADETTALVIEKAEGNPYYLREIIYALIDQGLVRQEATGAGDKPSRSSRSICQAACAACCLRASIACRLRNAAFSRSLP